MVRPFEVEVEVELETFRRESERRRGGEEVGGWRWEGRGSLGCVFA